MREADGGTADELDPERRLALHYTPQRARAALGAVWLLDARLRAIVLRAREPALAEIKLAWWEERLAALASGHAPAEPLLGRLLAIGCDGDAAPALASMAGAWRSLCGTRASSSELDAFARSHGSAMSRLAAHVLRSDPGGYREPELAGAALVDLARHVADGELRGAALHRARQSFDGASPRRWPRGLRPLGMLVVLARDDARRGRLAPPGSPRRVARMAWHAISGL